MTKNIQLTAAILFLVFYSAHAFRFYEPVLPPESLTKWYNYLTIEGRASVKFPDLYIEKVQSNPNGNVISAKCIRDNDQFMFTVNISVIPFPDPLATIKMILGNSIRNKGATIISDSNFTYKTYTGRQAVFKDMSGTYYYRGIIMKNYIYQMQVYTSKENIMSDIQTFFDSFEFKGLKE